jgi:hypothetical protein
MRMGMEYLLIGGSGMRVFGTDRQVDDIDLFYQSIRKQTS